MFRRAALMSLACALVACSSAEGVEPPAIDGGGDDDDGGTAIDAGSIDSSASADAVGPVVPARYAYGPVHSPMTASVISRLRTVVLASPNRKNVFAKIGDSHTVSTYFLHCFAGSDVRLGDHAELEASRAFFAETKLEGGTTSFDRTSLSAVGGWSTSRSLEGDPSPLEREVEATKPGFAVILFGTNDTAESGIVPFERALRGNVDRLLALGTVPLLTTIPPRGQGWANALVPEMNAVVRAVAQARQIPMLDMWSQLEPLADDGLVRDGVHLSVYSSGGAHGCWLTSEGLKGGTNVRNLVSLEALHRAKKFVLDGVEAEPQVATLAGDGTFDAPYAIDSLPFVDDRDARKSTSSTIATYPCGPQDESGPEVVYRLKVATAQKVRARVFVDDGVDVDLYWLDETATECRGRADKTLDLNLTPGTHLLAVDTFAVGGAPKSGAYRLTLVPVD